MQKLELEADIKSLGVFFLALIEGCVSAALVIYLRLDFWTVAIFLTICFVLVVFFAGYRQYRRINQKKERSVILHYLESQEVHDGCYVWADTFGISWRTTVGLRKALFDDVLFEQLIKPKGVSYVSHRWEHENFWRLAFAPEYLIEDDVSRPGYKIIKRGALVVGLHHEGEVEFFAAEFFSG